MKIITFRTRGYDSANIAQYRVGALISDSEVIDLTSLVSDKSLTATELLKCFDLDSGFLRKAEEVVNNAGSATLSLNDVEIAASVPAPGKIICIGLNYRDHAEE